MSIQDDPSEKDTHAAKINFPPASEGKEALRNIRDIKENVIDLAQNLKEVGREQAHMVTDYVSEQVENIKTVGTDTLEEVESRVKSNPGQSLAFAFVAGALVSYLLGRRSS